MQDLPHYYEVRAAAGPKGYVQLESGELAPMESAAPAEFGGPGDRWSPETLLVAAVADCFVLSFRAIATGFKFDWVSLSCDVTATLARIERATQFTKFVQKVTLEVPAGSDEAKAMRLLEKAEHACLVTNSLSAETVLEASVEVAA